MPFTARITVPSGKDYFGCAGQEYATALADVIGKELCGFLEEVASFRCSYELSPTATEPTVHVGGVSIGMVDSFKEVFLRRFAEVERHVLGEWRRILAEAAAEVPKEEGVGFEPTDPGAAEAS